MKRTSLLVVSCLVGLGLSTAQARTPIFLGKSAEHWQEQLSDSDAKVRRSAAFALGRMGEDGRSAATALALLVLHDADAGVRDMAASALGDITRALKGNAPDVWEKASGTLVKALEEDKDAHVRRSAAYALGTFGPRDVNAANAAPALRKALRDDNASVRQNAAWALGQIGEKAGEAVEALCACLRDKDTLVRRDAAGALGSLGKFSSAGVDPLIELVKSEPDEVVKKTALDSLARAAGPEHEKFAPELTPLLKDKDAEVRLSSAIVLANIGGPESARAVPVLRQALKDPDPEVPKKAAAALAAPSLGSKAAPAMYDLAEMLTNPKTPALVRGYAALAIAHIGPEAKPVVPEVVKALKAGESLEVRRYAAEALAQMKYPANEAALPAILNAIEKDTDPLVRQKCVWSLFTLGDPDNPKPFLDCGADRALAKLLEEPGSQFNLVRYDAARKLAQVLEADAPDKTADVLLDMLKNKELKVYNRTDATVKGAGTESTAAQVNVKANLGGDARYMAAQALGWMKGKAKARKDVMEALKEASKDEDPKLRDTAKKALKNLGD